MNENILESFEQGIIVTDQTLLSLDDLPQQLKAFVDRDEAYRYRFLQKNYGVAFDGYSYQGQKDSLNQGYADMLHSFVFSDFFTVEKYPQEFQWYRKNLWPDVMSVITELELSLLQKLPIVDRLKQQIITQYKSSFGHMMSANYYPAIANCNINDDSSLRLSEHPDVSLLTIFPFGIDQDFEYQNNKGQWCSAPKTDRIIAFPGDLLEWLTHGQVKALNHRVRFNREKTERFSFAFFSLPWPQTILRRQKSIQNKADEFDSMTTEQYYRMHLSQWD